MDNLQSLFDQHVGAAMLRQERLSEQVGGARWGVNLGDQTLTFQTDPPRRLTIQVLGSESESSKTWMWGWANAASELPPESLTLVEKLRAFGTAQGIPELTTPVLPLREWDGHRLSMVAAGMADAAGYFCCPYEGGALFVAIIEPEPAARPVVKLPVLRLTRALPEVISRFSVKDHRLALQGLATLLGLTTQAEGDALQVTGPDGSATARFDSLHRLLELKASLEKS